MRENLDAVRTSYGTSGSYRGGSLGRRTCISGEIPAMPSEVEAFVGYREGKVVVTGSKSIHAVNRKHWKL